MAIDFSGDMHTYRIRESHVIVIYVSLAIYTAKLSKERNEWQWTKSLSLSVSGVTSMHLRCKSK